MSTINENWSSLASGIKIPSLNVSVPWLTNVDDLFQIIPKNQFAFSTGGGWPILRFKFLGFSALWAFNFVTSPAGQLTELQFQNSNPHSPRRTYQRSRVALQKALGNPNIANYGLLGQQVWRMHGLYINNYILSGKDIYPGGTITVPNHFIGIRLDRGA